jgi:Na+/H+ antiporter NhaD/arsenite permease-like protein
MNVPNLWVGPACLAAFAIAYVLVAIEDRIHLRKSVPVMLAAGLIWVLVGVSYTLAGEQEMMAEALRHSLLEFAELFFFLLSAITFVNTLEDRHVFAALRSWLEQRKLTLRALFWATGALAFVLSPIADNLTTALVMGAVVLSVGGQGPRFQVPACINIVVAANAGGAFSPFGDITTLMVWQKGHVTFGEFGALFLPALVNWLVPALILVASVPAGRPTATGGRVRMRPGARGVMALFLGTIFGTVLLHQVTHLPPVLGMMTGLGALKLYSNTFARGHAGRAPDVDLTEKGEVEPADRAFDVYRILQHVEWDTLMFFYGVMLCVGGLGLLGYLTALSGAMYTGLGPTTANVLVGLLSAIIDNIPVMYAVLTMHPDMSHAQWLLVTLTAGVGGSLLSIGSAAGVALMGQARGTYTFSSHLRWAWAVAAGFAASIAMHLVVNGR